MSGVDLIMTDLGGYRASMTDADPGHACSMTEASVALPSTTVQASLGMSATMAMGAGAARPVRLASIGMSATAAMGVSADEVPATAQLALGAWFPPVAPLWSHDHAQNYRNAVGVKPGIVHWYQDLASNFRFNQYSDISLATAQGVTVMITYELRDVSHSGMQLSYNNAAILSGVHDAVITAFAQGAAAWGHPFLLRIGHEMTGVWYDWATGTGNSMGNSPTSFIAMWRHVWQLFRNAGATNAKFVFCPSVILPGPLVDMRLCYPGDAYVDWLSLDGYAWPTGSNLGWLSFGNVFKPSYDVITTLGSQPLIIGETGVVPTGGNKANWITDMGANAAALFPRLKAVVWFNSKSSATQDWRFNDTTDNLAAYASVAASAGWSALLAP